MLSSPSESQSARVLEVCLLVEDWDDVRGIVPTAYNEPVVKARVSQIVGTKQVHCKADLGRSVTLEEQLGRVRLCEVRVAKGFGKEDRVVDGCLRGQPQVCEYVV